MTPEDEEFERIAQRHIADLNKSSRAITEDAVVRAVRKVMAEFDVAQPEQEPVAYDKTEINCFAQDLYDQKMREGKRGHYESMFHVIHQCIKKVFPPATELREQEPVAWMTPTGALYRTEDVDGCFDDTHIPLYATPPANANAGKPWVGLTDVERDSFWRADQMTGEEWRELFDAIEAKLKEKNNG